MFLKLGQSGPAHCLSYCPISLKLSSDLWHQQYYAILSKPQRILCRTIIVNQQFLKYPDQPVWQQQSCHLQIHFSHLFFLNVMLGFQFSAGHLDPVCLG